MARYRAAQSAADDLGYHAIVLAVWTVDPIPLV